MLHNLMCYPLLIVNMKNVISTLALQEFIGIVLEQYYYFFILDVQKHVDVHQQWTFFYFMA